MFRYKDFWIVILIILLNVYILGKSKHLITGNQVSDTTIQKQSGNHLIAFIELSNFKRDFRERLIKYNVSNDECIQTELVVAKIALLQI